MLESVNLMSLVCSLLDAPDCLLCSRMIAWSKSVRGATAHCNKKSDSRACASKEKENWRARKDSNL
jgi:hypothetical protein